MNKDGNTTLIGRKIEVWWPGDESFYPGTVTSFQKETNLHRILYADDEMENLDLSYVCWRFQDEYASSTGSVDGVQAQSTEKASHDPSKSQNESSALPGRSVKPSLVTISREHESVSRASQNMSSSRAPRKVKSPKMTAVESEEALRSTARRSPEEQEREMIGQQRQKEIRSSVRPCHSTMQNKEHSAASERAKKSGFGSRTSADKGSNTVANPPASSYSPGTKKGSTSVQPESTTKVRGSLSENEKQHKTTKRSTEQKLGTPFGRGKDGLNRVQSRTEQRSGAPSVGEPRTHTWAARSEPVRTDSQSSRVKMTVDITRNQGSKSHLEASPLGDKVNQEHVQARDSGKMELKGSKKGRKRGARSTSLNADAVMEAREDKSTGKPLKGALDGALPRLSGGSSTPGASNLDHNDSGEGEAGQESTLLAEGAEEDGRSNLTKHVLPKLGPHISLQLDTPGSDRESVKGITELTPSRPSGTRTYQSVDTNIGASLAARHGRGKNSVSAQPDTAAQEGLRKDEVPAPHMILAPGLDSVLGEDVNLDARRKLLSRSQKGVRLQASQVAHPETSGTGSKLFQREDDGVLGKRPRAESPVQENKQIRRDDLCRVLQKLSESEAKQAMRTDKVHSAIVSGIASIQENLRPEKGAWRDNHMGSVVRTLEKTFTEILTSMLDKHIAGLSKEVKEAREEFDVQLRALGKEAKKTKDDLLFLKYEVELCKESVKQQMNLLMKTLEEKLSVFVAAERKHAALPSGSKVNLNQNTPNQILLAAPHSPSKRARGQAPPPSDSLASIASPTSVTDRNAPIPTHRLHEEWSKSLCFRKEEGTGQSFLNSRDLIGETKGLVQSVGQGDRASFRKSTTWGEKQDRCMYESRVKHKAKAIVARAVTVWLLETRHNCLTYNYNMWAQETSARCLKWVAAENLNRFESWEQALHVLSVSLGYGVVEIEWFTCRATSRNLSLARKNYNVWDPPPQDEEWAIEEILLRELSERYFLADSSYTFDNTSKGVLEVAIEICRHAGSADMYKVVLDGTKSLSPERLMMCKNSQTY